ncbi:MAG TPA: PQQ-dependent sugar dehydrogenase [Parapedobacter sp.]|uniref:PQQ-dependent sugar dehydrogenase n=1 Tax=Parapedobacter sp. TaxID=1958893 RepID=UPI002CC434C7|nr:PQQ-dependent sugar dehydrogenase [Parapedobacter sp.]HWK58086.1 PQQ-dependent sugar dehydrogenase [Parapedobacter sp.]
MKGKKTLLLCSTLAIGTIFLRCTGNDQDGRNAASQTGQSVSSEKGTFYIDTLHSGLDNPWGMAWLSDGTMLVTERKGEILVFKNDRYTGEKLEGLPAIYEHGQGGLLDIQAHPDYATNGWIYATYAKPGPSGGSTALIRFRLADAKIAELETLYQTTPLSDARVHFGSRIVFDNAGYLYFSTGERGIKENAQNLANDMGKIHRLHDDGRIPADNPFIDTPDAKASIWSYGHRNVQGLAYDSADNMIYATEHGPRGGDELNLIEKGKNYGWPVITYGIDYSGAIISELTEKQGMEQPIHYWTPSIATCGLLFYTGDQFPDWRGNLFTGALALMHVARVELKNGNYTHEEKLLQNIGRVRHIAQSNNGYIYVLTEGPGMLLKLIPTE